MVLANHEQEIDDALSAFTPFHDGTTELRKFTKIFRAQVLTGEDYHSLIQQVRRGIVYESQHNMCLRQLPAAMTLAGLANSWHLLVLQVTLCTAARLTPQLSTADADDELIIRCVAALKILQLSCFADSGPLFKSVKVHKLDHLSHYIKQHGHLLYQSTQAHERRNALLKNAAKHSSRRHDTAEQVQSRGFRLARASGLTQGSDAGR